MKGILMAAKIVGKTEVHNKAQYRLTRPRFATWLYTQNALTLAQQLGCHTQLIYYWRSGKCSPSLKYAEKLLDIYPNNLNLKDLIKNVKK